MNEQKSRNPNSKLMKPGSGLAAHNQFTDIMDMQANLNANLTHQPKIGAMPKGITINRLPM